MRGFQRHVSQDASDAFTGYDSKQGGFALGYDRLVGDYTVGLSMGTVRNQVDADDAAGNGHANSSLFSVYGGYSRNGSYLDGVLSYGSNHYKLARDILVGTTTTAATSSHDGHALSASLNGGVDYGLDKWNLGPFAALQYIRSREQAFSESGGPAGPGCGCAHHRLTGVQPRPAHRSPDRLRRWRMDSGARPRLAARLHR
ncbi:MAG: autotransporter outer membrane beta-barrel domain-containing protein [Pseudomonadota bacterium]